MGCVEFPCFFLLSYLGGFVFFSFCIERERERVFCGCIFTLFPPLLVRERDRERMGWAEKAKQIDKWDDAVFLLCCCCSYCLYLILRLRIAVISLSLSLSVRDERCFSFPHY
jgi:hypothetical protein